MLHASMHEPHGWAPALALSLAVRKKKLSSLSTHWQQCYITTYCLVTCSLCSLVSHWAPETSRLLLQGWKFDTKGPFTLKVIRLYPSFFLFKFAVCHFKVPLADVDAPSAAQGLTVLHGWEPSTVAVHPHEWWGVCLVVPMSGADVLLKPGALSGSPSVSAPWRTTSKSAQIPVCHFCLRLVMGYNTMWLSRNHPGQQYNLKKFPLLKLGPSRPILRNTKYSCLPPPVFVRVEGNLPYRPVLSCGPLPLWWDWLEVNNPGTCSSENHVKIHPVKVVNEVSGFLLGKFQCWALVLLG